MLGHQDLMVGAAALAVVAAYCCARHQSRHRHGGRLALVALVAMLVMGVGMVDAMMLGGLLLPSLGWAAVMAAAAGATLLAGRGDPMTAERFGCLALMAVLTALMAVPGGHHGHAHVVPAAVDAVPAGGAWLPWLAAGVAAVIAVGYAAAMRRRLVASRGWLLGERAAAVGSAGLMAAAIVPVVLV
ncbi:hypothetical protein E8D34_17005 [Nocardioides sp. GY 10113]|uniref:hypothetical protein n=1 Tax=Nocardioides sp. GY 10113 TaxID=2569761 RepID=UPI0010A8044A|nr:hypothetical protein [Nocardioides sp. GY 10113]TIC82183.1 hypothetical protein E8D34_17005 [Nocardioides sp. GY 10113]